jgi:SAP domain
MTSTTRQYRAAVSQAGSAVEKTAELWTQGVRQLIDRTYPLPRLPQVDLLPAVDRYFELVQRAVNRNHDLTVKWVKAASALPGVVSDRAESAGDVVRDKAETVERTAHERAEQAAHELAREARKVEREQARQAHRKARERYEGLTKAELSDLLAKRKLPKSGNVDELIERLVEADAR